MLIPDFSAYTLADDYASFAGKLRWFRMYCATQAGSDIEDYREGYESLHDAFSGIAQYSDGGLPDWIDERVRPHFARIEKLLEQKTLSQSDVAKLTELLLKIEGLEDSGDKTFRDLSLDWRIEDVEQDYYSKELLDAVSGAFRADDYDAVMVSAFKHLDRHLQTKLNVSPHEYFGEALVNYAFSPNQGAIQLNTHPNEQAGLRNLVSGAMALFRNPSAHRFMKHEYFTAATVVALVATIIQIADDAQKGDAANPS